ncbi:MAG: M20/M25/M40 family metallo-hydrolase [Clostridia bacterium]|nr:M20/M25/M40 family metallo-hydrolase [Clostridia bacterium]
MYILKIILAIIFLPITLIVVLVRTASFKPKDNAKVIETEEVFDKEKTISNLQQLIRCKTVSNRDPKLEDEKEFKKLIDLLPSLYPNVFKVCSFDKLPDRGLLFKWKGKNSDKPSVMMAHYDVVPVNEENWEKPPFDAVIEDGVLWGRGSLDTKVTFNGVLSSADHLIAQGFVPENDIYFAFSGGEEVMGNGAVHIVEYFKKNNITPNLVVDEGGAVVENMFPGVKVPCGLIGIAEKGMSDVLFTVKSNGGHASAPTPHSPVVEISDACLKLEKKPFKSHLTQPVAEMFDTLGRRSTFAYRMIFSNLWLFDGLLDTLCKKKGGELNALMRTTVAFTMLSGSKATNVIPPEATMIANVRINPADSKQIMLDYFNKTVDNKNVDISIIQGMEPSRVSLTDCDSYEKVASAVASTWKGCVVSPYLMVQCSDSRHYGSICDKVYRFSAMDLTSEERKTIHGNNERIRLETATKAVEFYIRLMRTC